MAKLQNDGSKFVENIWISIPQITKDTMFVTSVNDGSPQQKSRSTTSSVAQEHLKNDLTMIISPYVADNVTLIKVAGMSSDKPTWMQVKTN